MARFFWKNTTLDERQLLAASVGYSIQDRKGFSLPAKDHISARAPQQHGATYVSTFFRPRDLSFVVVIKGCSVSDFEDKHRALARLLNPLDDSELQISTRNNGLFRLACRPVTKSTLRMQTGVVGELLVQCRADDPYFLGPARQENFPASTVSALTIPFTIPAVILTGNTSELTVTNNGHVAVFPRIRVVTAVGFLINPVFTNVTTGDSLTVQGTFVAGNYVEVDMGARTVVDRLGNNLISQTSGVFWDLEPGDNDLRLLSEGTDAFGGVMFFTEAFLAVV